MTEAEKRRRFQRFSGWFFPLMMAGTMLAYKTLKLRSGEIAKTEFLWHVAFWVGIALCSMLIPWAEQRRLRRLTEERRQTRRPPLSLSA